jgi:putative copper resistance protein D
MDELISVVLRFALYTHLLALFGMALFGLYSLNGEERRSGKVLRLRPILTGTAFGGALLSLASMAQMAKTMSGATAWGDVLPHIQMMVWETEFGAVWCLRVGALLLASMAAAFTYRWPVPVLVTVVMAGGVAVASLAWAGHGAMDEGARRFWHFAADIVHMLAGAAWFGALIAFVLMLRLQQIETLDTVKTLSRTLSGFAGAGGAIVLTIVLTGAVNYWLVAGPTLTTLIHSTYGLLLLAKIAVFGAMLALAAVHRYRLAPQLDRAISAGHYGDAARQLRSSMSMELACGTTVLALIAWLGTLSPQPDMGL